MNNVLSLSLPVFPSPPSLFLLIFLSLFRFLCTLSKKKFILLFLSKHSKTEEVGVVCCVLIFDLSSQILALDLHQVV